MLAAIKDALGRRVPLFEVSASSLATELTGDKHSAPTFCCSATRRKRAVWPLSIRAIQDAIRLKRHLCRGETCELLGWDA